MPGNPVSGDHPDKGYRYMLQMNTLPLSQKCGLNIKHLLAAHVQSAVSLALISAGSIIWVYGMNSVLIPNHFLSGGLVGISLLVHYQYSSVGFVWIYVALNIPLLILAWRSINRQFLFLTIFGMGIFAVVSHLVKPAPLEIDDPILAALFAGVICGVGAGLILRSKGSGGGLDILSIYLRKKYGFQIGTTVALFNALVLLAGFYFYSLQIALYSLIFLFTTGKVINAIVTGFNRRKAMLIISDRPEAISDFLLSGKNRGATLLKGEGGFSHQRKDIILTVINMIELPNIKEKILGLDPEAFIVVNDTLEVMGKRQGNGLFF